LKSNHKNISVAGTPDSGCCVDRPGCVTYNEKC